jgi:hypothetical protein
LQLCFLEQDGKRLILRPHNRKFPVRILELSSDLRVSERIVGRVCFILTET